MRFATFIRASALFTWSQAISPVKEDPLPCKECPNGLSVVELNPEVSLRVHPIYISTYITHVTTLDVRGTTLVVTDVPTTLVTDFTVTETETTYQTGNPELYLTCPAVQPTKTNEHTQTTPFTSQYSDTEPHTHTTTTSSMSSETDTYSTTTDTKTKSWTVSLPSPSPFPPIGGFPDDCTDVPEVCEALDDINGLDLIVALPLCVAALGVRFVGAVVQCVPSIIGLGLEGETILECIENALEEICLD